jgi:hypothetical protein
MGEHDEKVRENYLRRQAKRLGWFLGKSRAKKINLMILVVTGSRLVGN